MKLLQVIFLGITKPIAPFWYVLVARHWRHDARNAVANHVLQNDLKHRLKRLWERKPEEYPEGWVLTPLNPWENQERGWVYREDYSKVHFWLLFWLVFVFDDPDSTCDCFDCHRAGDMKTLGSKYFNQGDAQIKRFRWYPCLRWQMRNTTMGFKYFYMDY